MAFSITRDRRGGQPFFELTHQSQESYNENSSSHRNAISPAIQEEWVNPVMGTIVRLVTLDTYRKGDEGKQRYAAEIRTNTYFWDGANSNKFYGATVEFFCEDSHMGILEVCCTMHDIFEDKWDESLVVLTNFMLPFGIAKIGGQVRMTPKLSEIEYSNKQKALIYEPANLHVNAIIVHEPPGRYDLSLEHFSQLGNVRAIVNLFNERQSFLFHAIEEKEKEHREIIDANQNQINRLAQQRQNAAAKNSMFFSEIQRYQRLLAKASKEQTRLQKLVANREQLIVEMENSFKSSEHDFEKKLEELHQLTDSLSKEKTARVAKARTAEAELQVRTGEVAQLKKTDYEFNKTSEQLQQQFDERLPQAKECWTGFQSEIQRLESQIPETNLPLMDLLKVLKAKGAEAEEEARRLLLASKSETEGELTKLRVNLADKRDATTKSHIEQVISLRQENETIELEISRWEAQVRKLVVENEKLSRKNKHLSETFDYTSKVVCF